MIQAMTMCLDFAPATWSTGTRLVAIALADRVNGDTLECWPSIADLERRTGLSHRAVQRHVRQLEQDGTITRLGQRALSSGSPGSNVWRWNLLITFQGGATGDRRGSATSGTPRGVPLATPEPLSNPHNEIVKAKTTASVDKSKPADPKHIASVVAGMRADLASRSEQ